MSNRKQDTSAKNKAVRKSTKAIPGAKFTKAQYSSVVNDAVMKDITLMECDFSVRPEYYRAKRLYDQGKLKLSLAFDFDVPGTHFDSETGNLVGDFRWSIVVRQGNSHLLKLACSYICHYSGLKKKNEHAAEYFLKKVGRFATYPYFRALAGQMSWASDADLPILPVLQGSAVQENSVQSRHAKSKPKRRPAKKVKPG